MDKVLELNDVENKELSDGQALYEMTQTPGFQVFLEHLQEFAIHTWVDPREIEGPEAEKEWKWKELNAFHAANNARELIEWVQTRISQSEYLQKKKSGEITVRTMGVGRS